MPDSVVAVTLIHGIAGRRQELCKLMRRTEERVAEEPGCRDSSTKSGEASCAEVLQDTSRAGRVEETL